MRGRRAITSLFDWLGLGTQGVSYEVVEVVQPVVQVPPFEWPPAIGSYTSQTALVAGTVQVELPFPSDPMMSRLWLHVWFNRTNTAAQDITQLRRGALGLQCLLTQLVGQGVVNQFYPLVGGNHANFGGVQPPNIFGVGPILSCARSPVQVAATSLAAIGNLNIAACYVDVPAAAPLPETSL